MIPNITLFISKIERKLAIFFLSFLGHVSLSILL